MLLNDNTGSHHALLQSPIAATKQLASVSVAFLSKSDHVLCPQSLKKKKKKIQFWVIKPKICFCSSGGPVSKPYVFSNREI